MALSTTSLAGGASHERSDRWPLIVEAALVAIAVIIVLPLFRAVALQDVGRNARFAGQSIAVRGLPDRVLPELCAAYGAAAEAVVVERLCGHARPAEHAPSLERMPAALTTANVRARQAFLAPLHAAQIRVAELRDQQREGLGDMLALGYDIDARLDDIQPFIDRYQLDPEMATGPRPLACAYEAVQAAMASAAPGAPTRDALRANALLLLAGAFDGHGAVPGLASVAMLPDTPAVSARCTGLGMTESLAAAALLTADARDARIALTKDEAMRGLLANAGWYWLGATLLGLLLLNLGRRLASPALGVAVALALWAVAAWLARVPWPFGARQAFTLGRESTSFFAAPAAYVLWMLGIALCVFLVSPWLRTIARAQRPASALAYPGLVLATGIGWVLLLDLSANGHFGNRYLALYHEGHFWLAMLTFSIVSFIRQPLGRSLAWTLALIDGIVARATARMGGIPGSVLILGIALGVTAVVATALANLRQLTSELGRLWLIIGAAWFFFMRGTPLTERLARSGNSALSLLRYASPLVFVVLVLVGAMVFTQDMGPLLIAGYGAGALVAAALAMWRHQRTGAIASAYALAVALFVAWIAFTTFGLFHVASYDQIAAARLENAAAPLASANDQLALVTWFQRSAPPAGYGPGAVPWCGYGASSGCAGVPAQIQSDYTFTALVGMFGWTTAWCITLACVIWLYLVVRGHSRANEGEPRLVRLGNRMASDEQALLSWVCVCWVALTLCQLAVTVTGNLAVIPLTGVTFPFVSFGMASLLVNAAMLALAANVNGTGPTSHG